MKEPKQIKDINELDVLVEAFNKKGKNKIEVYKDILLNPTSIPYLNYNNGFRRIATDDRDIPIMETYVTGIPPGTIGIIGKSGVGKTTAAVKLATDIVTQYMSPALYRARHGEELDPKKAFPMITFMDIEKTFKKEDVLRISRMPKAYFKRYVTILRPVTLVEVVNIILLHIEIKKNKMGLIKMPCKDYDGEPIYDYPTSCIIIDSVSNLVDIQIENFKDYEKIDSNTAGARMAKAIGTFNTWLTDICIKYNIIVFNINHINVATNMTGGPVEKQYKGLKPNETVKGGNRQLYLLSLLLRLDHVKIFDDMNSSVKMNVGNVNGSITRFKIIKTKTNIFGRECLAAMTENGYDSILSTVINAIELGHIKRKGNSYQLDGCTDTFKRDIDDIYDYFNDPKKLDILYSQLQSHWITTLSNSTDLAKYRQAADDQINNKSNKDSEYDPDNESIWLPEDFL